MDRPDHSNCVQSDSLRLRLTPLGAAVRRALYGGFTAVALAQPAQATLPVPSNIWIPPQFAGGATHNVVGNQMTIDQHLDRVVLDWDSFNISADAAVRFNQPKSTSAALNRIHDANPSSILGNLTANGQVFLVNRNGILFGEGARVNVNTLVASSLEIREEVFLSGLAAAGEQLDSALTPFLDANDNPLPSGDVIVEQGAQLSADSFGRLMLVGANVENRGSLEAADGQVILAAGDELVLLNSTDSDLRGFLVEVANGGTVTHSGEIVTERGNTTLVGLAVNQSGRISATTSLDVNGSIHLLARDGGSVQNSGGGGKELISTHTGALVIDQDSVTEVVAEIGPQNLPLSERDTAIDEQPQPLSQIELMGRTIHLRGNSRISARGGEVTLNALSDPSDTSGSPLAENDVRIQMESAALIDVSGYDASKEMASNQIEVELRGNEFADAPLQKNGPLRGEKVNIDIREGTPVADVGAFINSVPKDLAERLSAGGSVTFNSSGEVRLLAGAEIDVSGGTVDYAAGNITTSQLLAADGRLVDIADASPDVPYRGVARALEITDEKWQFTQQFVGAAFSGDVTRYHDAYQQGQDAGRVVIEAPGMLVENRFVSDTTVGEFQRNVADRPNGGELVIGLAPQAGELQLNRDPQLVGYRAPNIEIDEFSDQPSSGALDFNTSLMDLATAGDLQPQQAITVQLDAELFSASGFSDLTLRSNGEVRTSTSLQGDVGGSLDVIATQIVVADDIIVPGGRVKLVGETANTAAVTELQQHRDALAAAVDPALSPADLGTVSNRLLDDVTIDVSGRWSNDFQFPGRVVDLTAPLIRDGGTIELALANPGELTLGDRVWLNAQSGAHLDGELKLAGGSGGLITLDVGDRNSSLAVGAAPLFTAHGVAAGGSFDLTTPGALELFGNQTAASRALQNSHWQGGLFADNSTPLRLPAGLFDGALGSGGFASINLATINGSVTVEPASDITLVTEQMVLGDQASFTDSGAHLGASAIGRGVNLSNGLATVTPPFDQTAANQITLSANSRKGEAFDLVVGSAASIEVAPRGAITLAHNSNGLMSLEGALVARGGDVVLSQTKDTEEFYNSGHQIWIGHGASIDVSATFLSRPDPLGRTFGDLVDAGSLSVSSDGFVLAAAGAQINLAGDSFRVNLDQGGVADLHARGGNLNLSAVEGLLFNAEVDAAGPTAATGGSLQVTSLRRIDSANGAVNATYPTQFEQIRPGSHELPAGFVAGGDPLFGDGSSASPQGTLWIDPQQLATAGFGAVNLTTTSGSIAVDSDLTLNVGREINLVTSHLQLAGEAELSLVAPVVTLGDGGKKPSASAIADSGDGSFSVTADFVQFNGGLEIDGVKRVNIASSGEIQLRGAVDTEGLSGALLTSGLLDLSAELIYPTTLSDFTIEVAQDAAGTSLLRTAAGGSTGGVLSAAGAVRLIADDIVHAGALSAPFGEITLTAADTLTLLPGSLTNVSGSGLSVPLGYLQNGRDWFYNPSGNPDDVSDQFELFTETVQRLPQKRVELIADDVDVRSGATINLAGGGELFGYEFVPGPGGSDDVLLANLAGEERFWAILPGYEGFNPADAQENSGRELKPGDAIFLSEVEGLINEGTYTLLPSRYAMLPGAILIEKVDGLRDISLGDVVQLADGSAVSAGYRTRLGLADSRTSGFVVRRGDYLQQLSQLDRSSLDPFAVQRSAALDLPRPPQVADAASLLVDGASAIRLAGSLITDPAAGGVGVRADIIADHLQVSAQIAGLTDRVELLDSDLSALNVESLLLGGRRDLVDGKTEIDVLANQVTFAANSRLESSDIMAAAADQITIAEGVELIGSGKVPSERRTRVLQGDSAFVEVSSGALAEVERSGASGTTGSIDIAQGATLEAVGGSITLDGSFDVTNLGTINARDGDFWVASSNISIGNAPGGTAGFVVSEPELAAIDPARLFLVSNGGIDIYGDLNLTLEALTIDGAGMSGFASDTTVTAGRVELRNSRAQSPLAAQPDSGDLVLDADVVEIGDGDFEITGFGSTVVMARNETLLSGDGELTVSGDLDLDSPGLLTLSGVERRMDIGGDLRIGNGGLAVHSGAGYGVGAELEFVADNIAVDSAIVAASGSIEFQARSGDLTIEDDARLFAGGVQVFDRVGDGFATSAGAVKLFADSGKVVISDQAVIDLSAPNGANGGVLVVGAADVLNLDAGAQLFGGSDGDGRQGRAFFDTGGLAGVSFGELNQLLNQGGFTSERVLRQRQGDMDLLQGELIQAHRTLLIADAGAISVDGTIDATGIDGGEVEIWAQQDLLVDSHGVIDAHATGATGKGGKVILASQQGMVDVAPSFAGVAIDVTGGFAQETDADGNLLFDVVTVGGATTSQPTLTQQTGEVLIRAPRNGTDINVAGLDGTIQGARRVVLEGVQSYQATAIDNALIGTISADAGSYATAGNETAVLTRLNQVGNDRVHLVAGVEIQSAGDINLNTPFDLAGLRFNGQPLNLTLRAAGDITLDHLLGDGFGTGGQLAGFSSDIRIAAGADLASAYTASAVAGSGGDLTVADTLRTGTGDITIAASGDLHLHTLDSVIYSAGQSSGFDLDRHQVSDPLSGKPASTAALPTDGGDLRIAVGGDVIGPGGENDQTQIGTDWLTRMDYQQDQVFVIIPGILELVLAYEELEGWGVDFGGFQQQIAAFGGGDVDLHVGGDLVRTGVSLPTTYYIDPLLNSPNRLGEGKLNATIGGDVTGGLFFIGDGAGQIDIGGALEPGWRVDSTKQIGGLFGLLGGSLEVNARQDLILESVYDPVAVTLKNQSGVERFPGYREQSSAAFSSLVGDIILPGNGSDIRKITATELATISNDFKILPGSFSAIAHQGDVSLAQGTDFRLASTTDGGLTLLAGSHLLVDSSFRQYAPFSGGLPDAHPLSGPVADYYNLADGLREDDLTPSILATAEGDIRVTSPMTLNEQVMIDAGKDLRELILRGRNNNQTDVTRIAAGRDIRFTSNDDLISIAGPGTVLMSAGRHLDLGTSVGLETKGNLVDPRLAEQGAAIYVSAGVGNGDGRDQFLVEYFAQPLQQLADQGVASEQTLGALAGLVNQLAQQQVTVEELLGGGASQQQIDQLQQAVDALMVRLADSGLTGPGPDRVSSDELLANGSLLTEAEQLVEQLVSAPGSLSDRLRQLPDAAGQLLAAEGFFNELRAAGSQAGDDIAAGRTPDYSRGFAAIETLFDESVDYQGDLSLLWSKIYTVDGGEINILVPGGAINGGVNVKPPRADDKGPSELGIVAQGEGELNIFSSGDFLVNASRAMTLGGGDLTAWSSFGDIDAGRGAKSAIAAPAPSITTDSSGNVSIDFSSAVSGSGIRTVAAGNGTRLADAFLIAPNGEVSAGDAGIDVSGRVVIAAPRVVGLDNISGGVSVNVAPPAEASVGGLDSLGGVLASVTNSVVDSVGESGFDDSGATNDGQPSVWLMRFEYYGVDATPWEQI